MGVNEMEHVAGAVASAVIRNRDLKNVDAAAEVYFECLEALMAKKKLRDEAENRRILSESP